MIKVTRLDNTEIVINAELIESVEEAPDTIISTTTNKKYYVKETAELVIEKIIQYRKFIISGSDEIFNECVENEI
jgi:flagellar protein FlbD